MKERERTQKDYGYITLEGKTTPSDLIKTMSFRLVGCDSGGKHPKTSVHRTSTYGDGSEPKKTLTGSFFEKFSP
jgi:hypothetical protein